MIVTMEDGRLREKLTGHMTFVYDVYSTPKPEINPEIQLTTLDSIGFVRPKLGEHGMMLDIGCSFSVGAIDSFFFTYQPELFMKTMLNLRIGEKTYLNAPVVGEEVVNNYYRHHEYAHQADGSCDCPIINPAQYFYLSLTDVPTAPIKLQVTLIGSLFRPVP